MICFWGRKRVWELYQQRKQWDDFAVASVATVWGLHVLDGLADGEDRASQQAQWLWSHVDSEPPGGPDGYSLGVATSTERQEWVLGWYLSDLCCCYLWVFLCCLYSCLICWFLFQVLTPLITKRQWRFCVCASVLCMEDACAVHFISFQDSLCFKTKCIRDLTMLFNQFTFSSLCLVCFGVNGLLGVCWKWYCFC